MITVVLHIEGLQVAVQQHNADLGIITMVMRTTAYSVDEKVKFSMVTKSYFVCSLKLKRRQTQR